jgi:outer membrane protein insertion porin family
MNNKIKNILLSLLITGSCFSIKAEIINKIEITGQEVVEKSTIEKYLDFKNKESFSKEKEGDAVKRLYSTGFFDDVSIDFRSGVLHVRVKENKFVSKVLFVGNSRIKKSIIEPEINVKAGHFFSKANIEQDVSRIKEIYKKSGRFLISVEAKVKELPNNRVSVVYEIKEGPKTAIKNISFVGNESFSQSDLKAIILTKESKWFRIFDSNDSYDPDKIKYDEYILKNFYQSLGYADFRVLSSTAELSKTKESINIIYSIEEGEKYNFGELKVDNKIKDIDDSVILKFLKIDKNSDYDLSKVEDIVEKISEHIKEIGYPEVSVNHEISKDFKNKTVSVIFVVDNAPKIYVNKINIHGNYKTIDKVIRRQMRLSEGDIYKYSAVQKSERNIRNLNFFENVSISPSQSKSLEKADIDVFVEEKSTAALGFEAGYNTVEGPFGKISMSERNFVGTGKSVDVGVQRSRKKVSYFAGLVEPYFMDKDLSLGVNFMKIDNGKNSDITGFQPYDSNSKILRVSSGYDIATDLSHDIFYSIKQEKLSAPKEVTIKGEVEVPDFLDGTTSKQEVERKVMSSIAVLEKSGNVVTSSIGQSFSYDKTDMRHSPKNGYIASLSQEFAGVGGDTRYIKNEVDVKLFKSFAKNKYTFKVSTSTGYIFAFGKNQTVGISDRFSLGDFSLRGFSAGGVGPRYKPTKESLNGKKFYTITTEVNFPLGLPKDFNVTGALFMDVGGLWDFDIPKTIPEQYKKEYGDMSNYYNSKKPRVSIGFGVLWITKFAPIRIDYAIPIKKESYDERQSIHVRMATYF